MVVEFLADFCAVELLLEIGKLFVVVLLDLQVCAQSLSQLVAAARSGQFNRKSCPSSCVRFIERCTESLSLRRILIRLLQLLQAVKLFCQAIQAFLLFGIDANQLARLDFELKLCYLGGILALVDFRVDQRYLSLIRLLNRFVGVLQLLSSSLGFFPSFLLLLGKSLESSRLIRLLTKRG
ncbi:hypothetical protein ACPA9J_15955 [Pseudomonas aeruginosa]